MRNLILGLARPLLRRSGRGERGALGVLIALFLGAGVLTGMGALVIDVGQLYQERAELQNGADAAALAVAKSCISGACASSLATTYAGYNSKDGSATSVVCGSVSPLTACAPTTGGLDCPDGAAGTNYVDVNTSTKLSSGATLLPPVFAKTLLGNSGFTGTTVLACAQATWGAVIPSNPLVTAFTISACEWNLATTTGTIYAQPPPRCHRPPLTRRSCCGAAPVPAAPDMRRRLTPSTSSAGSPKRAAARCKSPAALTAS